MGAFFNSLITSQIHPATVDWVRRVLVNGAALPSRKSIWAANRFYERLSDGGVLSSVKAASIFVPDSLIASITPLIKAVGNDPWTNNNFVAGDLTIDGLKGNGSNKYLLSNIIASSYASTSSAALVIYISAGATGAETDIGCAESGTSNHRLSAQYNSVTTYSANDDSTSVTYNFGSTFTGYLCGSKVGTGASNKNLYLANSSLAHASVAVGSTSGGTVPVSRHMPVFASNEAGTIGSYSSKRLSFAAYCTGLTAAQSFVLYSAIQELRQNLGGGYV